AHDDAAREPRHTVDSVECAERAAALVHGDHLRDATAQARVLHAVSYGPTGRGGHDSGKASESEPEKTERYRECRYQDADREDANAEAVEEPAGDQGGDADDGHGARINQRNGSGGDQRILLPVV